MEDRGTLDAGLVGDRNTNKERPSSQGGYKASALMRYASVIEVKTETQANAIVDELLPFKDGLGAVPLGHALKVLFSSLYAVFTLAPSLIGRIVVNTSGLIFFNMIKDPEMQASFGVYDGYYFVFYFSLITALLDKFSIEMSVAFGEKNYEKIRDVFTKSGLVCLILFILVTLPMMAFSSPILTTLGISPDIASVVQDTTRMSIPLIGINTLSEYIKAFCLSQGHEKVFGYTSLASLTLTIIANYFVMIEYRYGIHGWIYTKTANEFVTLVVTIVVYFKAVPETRGFVSLNTAMKGFGVFFYDSIKFMFGLYPECLGFELTGFFIALTDNTDQIAAYYCTVNITSMMFCVGFAFAIICRTRMNILLGMGHHQAAKNYFKFYVGFNLIIGGVIGVFLYVCRDLLVRLYSDSTPDMKHWFFRLVLIYSIVASTEIAMNTVMVGVKSIGKIGMLLFLNVMFPLVGNLAGGLVIHHYGLSCDAQFANYMVICTFLTILVLVIGLCADWSKALENTGKPDGVLMLQAHASVNRASRSLVRHE